MVKVAIKFIIRAYFNIITIAAIAGLGKIVLASKKVRENYGSNETVEAISGLGFLLFSLALLVIYKEW